VTGRDDARAHPSTDELADLREGLLSDADDARVRAHVEVCSECASDLAALDEVTAVLRAAGAVPEPMPAAVARAIDQTLRDAAASASALPRRSPDRAATGAATPQPLRWVRPAFGWLAGAAAAVVVIGGIGVGLANLGSRSDNDAEGAGGSASVAGSDGVRPNADEHGRATLDKAHRVAPHLDETSLQAYASALAARPTVPTVSNPDSASGAGGVMGRSCQVPRGIGGLRQPVVWHAKHALLVLMREARVASVYSCDPTPRLLYSAPY
jgi:hypothetical protein